MKCRVCLKSENVNTVAKKQSPCTLEVYSLYYCDLCQSYFFDLNQHKVNLVDVYNEDFTNYTNQFHFSKHWDNQVELIESILLSRENSLNKSKINVLDIGCRTGDFLNHFDKSKYSLFGVELNKHNAEIARTRGINIYSDYVENILFNEKFDIVTCYAVLEHLEYPSSVIEKLASLVNPNGVMVILIPTIECKIRKELDKNGIHWHMYSPPQHLNFFSRKFLDEIMALNQLERKKRYYTSGGMRWTYKYYKGKTIEEISGFYTKKSKLERYPTIISKLFNRIYDKLELFNFINTIPYYDHMYSYYLKNDVT